MNEKCRSVRSARLLEGYFLSSLDHIFCTGFGVLLFCNKFCLRDSGNTRESFPPESKRTDTQEVLHIPDLACGVAQESASHLIMGNPASVIRDADKINPSVFDLYGYRRRPRVDGVLHQFFYNGRRAFNHFPCRDLIDCYLIQYLNVRHILLLFFLCVSFSLCTCPIYRSVRHLPAVL